MKKKPDQEKHEDSGNKKRLLSGCPKAAATNRVVATAAAHNMKTRDLPNLTECQACGFRIDSCTTGKTTIQILYSEWRIVLLCQKCLSLIESSQICSYCFKQVTQDFFRCCQCNRCVHRNCFFMYKSVSPWSYSSAAASSQFSFCMDCWVPNSIIRKRAFFRARKSSENCPELYNSNYAVKGCSPSLEANCDGDHETRKAAVAKKAEKLSDQGCGNVNKAIVDDAEIAFRLHRVMNSSPRISKNFCAVNSSCSSVPKMKEVNDDSTAGGSGSRDSSDGVRLELYMKSNENSLVCVENENAAVPFKEGEGSCSDKLVKSSGDENSMNLECIYCLNNPCQSSTVKVTNNGKSDRYLLKYKKRNSTVKGVPNQKSKTLSEKFSCGSETLDARFLFKYRKRNSSTKGTSNVKPETLYERFPCQSETLATRYLFKYRKRKTSVKAVPNDNSKANSERIPCQSEDLAAELPLNCSGESRAFSNGSLQSCAFSLQASASQGKTQRD